MPTRLPPLKALRAFDAAARHMSFARAAEEVGVTPAALSFQIKTLEEHLGQPLFRRLNRAVELTEAGRVLAPGTAEGFRSLQAAWRDAGRVGNNHTLTVTAGPAFTARWMAPRFYEFARAHPEIELRFSASLRPTDFERDAIDVAIRLRRGPDDQTYSVPLAFEWVTPVMLPEMAELYPTPESLTKAPLLVDDALDFVDPPCDWAAWFRAVGISHRPEGATHFSQSDHAVDATLAGAGVTLGRRSMVIKELHEGRLVAPYGIALKPPTHFRFICPKGNETRPAIAAFRDWILSEIDKTSAVSDTLTIIPSEDVPRDLPST